MTINGRGRLEASQTVFPGGVLIRVDDGRDDAFWLEVFLSASDLRAMLAAAEAAEGEEG